MRPKSAATARPISAPCRAGSSTGHPAGGKQERRAAARRDRQAGQRLPRRPVLGPAGGAGHRTELRPSGITIWKLPVRPERCACLSRTANTTETIPRAAAGPDGGHRAAGLYRRGKAADRQDGICCPSSWRLHGLNGKQLARVPTTRCRRDHRRLHPGGRRAARWSGRLASCAGKAALQARAAGCAEANRRVNGSESGGISGRAPAILPDMLPGLRARCGLVNGLAWTAVGGETLEVEVSGHARHRQAGADRQSGRRDEGIGPGGAAAIVRAAAAAAWTLTADFLQKQGHPHPRSRRARCPRTGPRPALPSATALVSALTGRAGGRRDVAMTGEVTLRGRVLPIGGLREKTMAALRHGVRTGHHPQGQ